MQSMITYWRTLRRNRTQVAQALRPGLGIKRWIGLLLLGVTVAGAGFFFALRALPVDETPGPLVVLTLGFLPDWMRGLTLITLGMAVVGVGIWQLNRQVVLALVPHETPPGNVAMVSTLLTRQQKRRGPRIVAIGGGTGMPQLLRGLRQYTDNITAVVTVADDGGSSGRLREQMGTLPPGDFRNNIAALSESEDLMLRLFQYRFADRDVAHDVAGSELAGHSFGNLFIATMAAVTGSFERGIAESSRVLTVRGRILPSTLDNITLCAEISRPRMPAGTPSANGTAAHPPHDTSSSSHAPSPLSSTAQDDEWLMVEGESNIPNAGGKVMRVFLKPDRPPAYPEVIKAILQADLIVAGPGSFFTSVMPNLLVPGVREAIMARNVPRLYICNVATQPGETDGYTVSDHMRQLRLHAESAFTTVLANDNYDPSTPPYGVGQWVTLPAPNEVIDYRLFTGNLVEDVRPWHHDSQKLAARVMEIYQELASAPTDGVTPSHRGGG